MNYTKDQEYVIDKIKEFLNQKDNLTCILDAPGGTGKTYTISYFKKDALYLCPTNQAKKVLQEQGIFNVYTIARFLQMEMDYNEEGEEIPVYKGFDNTILKDTKLIIVDECSMLNNRQIKCLLQTNRNILFTGDSCQLPPVKEKIVSDVFQLNHWEKLKLTTNIRADNQDLQKINLYYRNIIKNIKCSKIDLSKNLINKQNVPDLFNPEKDIRLVTYTNKSVNKWNNLIREKLYPTNFNQKFVLGEKLIIDAFITVSKEVKYYTGDPFIIEELEIVNKNYNYEFCKCDKCSKYIPKKYKILDKIEVCIETFEIKNNGNVFYHPIDEENLKLLTKIFLAKKCLIKNSSGDKKQKWKDLYNWYKKEKIPLIYPYATTIHKAQGSGFQSVIFDPVGLFYNDLSRKLKYVAVSRAKENLFIVN